MKCFCGALKTGQNEMFHIFWEIDIPAIKMFLSENFQNLLALQVWCNGFTKIVEWFRNGTALNSSGGRYMQILIVHSHW